MWKPAEFCYLLNTDPLFPLLGHLGDGDGEDTVLQGGLDVVLVDASGEVEGPLELADAAFLDPDAVGRARRLGYRIVACGRNLLVGGVFGFVLYARLLRRGFGGLVVIAIVGAGGVAPFDATIDDNGLLVAEVDIQCLFVVDTRELALENERVFSLVYVELGLEQTTGVGAAGSRDEEGVLQQAPERGAGRRVLVGVIAWEERHVVEGA